MFNHLHTPNLRQVQPPTADLEPEPRLLEGEAVVPALPAKAGKARWLTLLGASEEGIKGQMHAVLDVLQHLRVDLLQVRSLVFPEWKKGVGLVQADALLPFFPGVLAIGKGFFVD